MTWDANAYIGGTTFLQVVMSRPGGSPKDVTYFRGAPTQVTSFASGDPFGPAIATLTFPSVTAFDDVDGRGGHGVGEWLADYSNVIIYLSRIDYDAANTVVDPVTNQLRGSPKADPNARDEVWRGFVVSIDIPDERQGVTVQCQGSLFQLDRYMEKPYFPPRPQAMEYLIAQSFDPSVTMANGRVGRPNLRTTQLEVAFPAGWQLKGTGGPTTPYLVEGVAAGANWSGYSTRATGAWDRSLTGFVQGLLAVMYVPDEAGVNIGDQWTILPRGNTPVLQIRDRFKEYDFTLWYGTPGVSIRVNRDTSPVANIIYGEGSGTDGAIWRSAVISPDGSHTSYEPLAFIKQVYPAPGSGVDNKLFDKNIMLNEQKLTYGAGFGQDMAIQSAEKSLGRDQDPGWNGSVVLKVDPEEINKFAIKAGMTVLIKGVFGTGDVGVRFHIADMEAQPMENTVTMKIDTRYRDLLNLEESQVRTRDPLTPAKMLQINNRSSIIEDVMAPWDYSAGSGYVPFPANAAVDYYNEMSRNAPEPFPYKRWIGGISTDLDTAPASNSGAFVRCKAAAKKPNKRWTFAKVMLSAKGEIRLSQIAAYNGDGTPALCDFHVSIYYPGSANAVVDIYQMPKNGKKGQSDPFDPDAFESIDPTTNLPWVVDKDWHMPNPDAGYIIGWGNAIQRAGYSPGRFSDGHGKTGLLIDESPWSYDFTNSSNFVNNVSGPKPIKGLSALSSDVLCTVAFYATHTQDVYFAARFYRNDPGSG